MQGKQHATNIQTTTEEKTMNTFDEIIHENKALYNQEALILQATELLSTIMDDGDISKAELARKLGRSKAYVTQCLSGRQNLTLRTLADFFTALERRLELGAVPADRQTGCAVHRLYPVGGWSYEKQRSGPLLIDCAASASDKAESEFCYAA